jgi:diaminohydroxyphosphoribosylaminopyrimidine deaminase/5-amino-6-(5-phosphoribosylamino)uracil reductase
MFSTDDSRYMSRALQLAQRGLYTTRPNPRVGCVIVKDDRIVGEGWHQIAGEGHAEVHALAAAGEQARGATLYVTLEPCAHKGRTPPCANALIEAGIVEVVSAMDDPNPEVAGKGHQRLRDAGIRVRSGLLSDQAEALNVGFLKRMRQGMPFVRLKSGISTDARTAMASGESQWITSPASRLDVQRLRARSDAIVTGVDTVIADDPLLTVRVDAWPTEAPPIGWPEGQSVEQPLRVVMDSRLRTPPSARMLREPGETLIVCHEDHQARREALENEGAAVICLPGFDGRVDLHALLGWLAGAEVNEVLVEAGARLQGEFFSSGVADEWVVYQAPVLMGSNARPVLNLPGVETMSDKIPLTLVDTRAVGPDWRFTYRCKPVG